MFDLFYQVESRASQNVMNLLPFSIQERSRCRPGLQGGTELSDAAI